MEKKQEIPHIVKIGAWLLSLIVFAVGFWHTHLGLKEMRPFGSEYGSIAIAAIVLLLLLITYYFAVSGSKTALIFYVFCGLFFFTFNMNYFYPSYVGRQLVKEEAISLNDTLQKFSNQSKNLSGTKDLPTDNRVQSDLGEMIRLKDKIVGEIKEQGGCGTNCNFLLDQFNNIAAENKLERTRLSGFNTTTDKLADLYERSLTGVIEGLMTNNLSQGVVVTNAANLLTGMKLLDSTQKEYTPILKNEIIPDNSEIKLDSIKTNKQINILQNIVDNLNEATSKINESRKKNIFTKLNDVQTRNLGRIAHTASSVKERIDKVDTWSIIFICLFIDLLVPLAIYLLLKKKEGQEDKIKPITTPGHF